MNSIPQNEDLGKLGVISQPRSAGIAHVLRLRDQARARRHYTLSESLARLALEKLGAGDETN